MHILFVCSANRLRSRTAKELFEKRFPEHTFDSCGTNPSYVKATQKFVWPEAKLISQEIVDKADLVICMENEHLVIVNSFKDVRATRLWNIPDIYDRDDPVLVNLLVTEIWW